MVLINGNNPLDERLKTLTQEERSKLKWHLDILRRKTLQEIQSWMLIPEDYKDAWELIEKYKNLNESLDMIVNHESIYNTQK